MSPKRDRWDAPIRTTRTRLLAIIGVVVFLLLDAGLIAFSLTRGEPGAGLSAGPIPTFAVPTSSSSPTPTPSAAPSPVAAPQFMVAASGTVGWRGTGGACPGEDSLLQGTSDGGKTWQTVSSTALGLHQTLAMIADDESTLRVLGRTGPGCATEAFASFTGGDFWGTYPDTISQFAYLDPANPQRILSAGGEAPAPCENVLQVQSRGDSIAALCPDQFFERGPSAGAWLSLPLPGLLAITASGNGYTLAVSGVADCAGVSIQSLPSPIETAAPTPIGCVPDEVAPQHLTLAQAGSTVWMWTDDRFLRSTDGGATWGL